MASSTRERRKPISLRIPQAELSRVEKYAADQRISKSDAFLHFLTKGLNAEKEMDSRLDSIQQAINETLRLVKQNPVLQTADEIAVSVSAVVKGIPDIKKVYLFGSFARGDATAESDVDLRFVIDETSSFSLFDLARVKESIEKQLHRETDIITAKEIKNTKLKQAIEREGILIYKRS